MHVVSTTLTTGCTLLISCVHCMNAGVCVNLLCPIVSPCHYSFNIERLFRALLKIGAFNCHSHQEKHHLVN